MMVILNQNNLELQQQPLRSAIDELEASTKTMAPHLTSQLNQARNQALEELKSKQSSHLMYRLINIMEQFYKPSFAFAVPIFIVGLFMFNPIDPNLMSDEQDIYADIELLEDEEQLDFLADLDISDWIITEDDS